MEQGVLIGLNGPKRDDASGDARSWFFRERRMFLSSLTEGGATPALVKTMVFNQAKLQAISQNVANINTPGYRAKHLDTKGFQAALRDAFDRRSGDPRVPFTVSSGSQVRTQDDGTIEVTPTEIPVENILFHDGTNLSIEQQMSELAETGMMHDLASTMLKGRYDALRKAIIGRA